MRNPKIDFIWHSFQDQATVFLVLSLSVFGACLLSDSIFPQTMQTTQNHLNWVTFTSMWFLFVDIFFLHFQLNFRKRNESVSCSLIRLRLGELNFISIKYRVSHMNLFRSTKRDLFICSTIWSSHWHFLRGKNKIELTRVLLALGRERGYKKKYKLKF